MKPYSTDLREKVIQAYLRGDSSLRDIAKRFFVSLNFVWLLWQRYLATGSVETKPHTGGRVSIMTEERLSILRDLVEEQNDATLKELQEKFRDKTGIMVSSGTLSRALKKRKLPRKKKPFMLPNWKTTRTFFRNAKNISRKCLRWTRNIL